MLLTHLMSGAEDPRFLRAVKSHPRYHLRLTAIIAAAFGIFFNVLAIAIAQELIMSGLAFIPVSDSYRQVFNSWLSQIGIDRTIKVMYFNGLAPYRSRLDQAVQKRNANRHLHHG